MFDSRARRLAALVTVLVALIALGWWLFPSNARRIKARLHTLAALVSEPAAEQDLARLARARKFGAMMTPDVAVSVEGRQTGLNGRDALTLIVARPSGIAGGIQVEISDISVQVGPSGYDAVSTARARLTFNDARTGQPSAEDHPVRLEWRKIDGEWLVAVADIGGTASLAVNAAG